MTWTAGDALDVCEGVVVAAGEVSEGVVVEAVEGPPGGRAFPSLRWDALYSSPSPPPPPSPWWLRS